jgi:recombinational DNA repair ATPase RecF
MDDMLLGIVLRRMEDIPPPEQAANFLLAALEGDESLATQLGGQAQPRSKTPDITAPPTPAGAYLRALTVSGFRGIGTAATLAVVPRPGLTLVVGRNGSGKSSFAEALEVLLTGNLRRWEKLPAVWGQGWRNIHRPETARITAELLIEGAAAAKVERTWPAGADFAGSSVTVQVAGEKQADLERLGWTSALADYRPFLSHSELEAFFGVPSGLYELLASVLGLEDLTLAAARLAQARKTRETAFADVKKRLPGALTQLEKVDDERAEACRRALAGRSWDLATVRAATTGAPKPAEGSDLDRLGRLAQLSVPAELDVLEITEELRHAAAGLAAVAGSPAGQARALARLLTAALDHHDAHGDGDCPVCGRPGALTMPWRQASQEAVAKLQQEAQSAEAAEQAAVDARQRAAAFMSSVPAVLLAQPRLPGVETGPALAAWQRWASPPDAGAATGPAGLRGLADHLDQEIMPLTREINALSDLAAAEVARREDRWAPVAVEVASWCADATRATDGMAPVPTIKAAEAWLKDATDDIRNDRLAPLAEQARGIWRMLRQESNVDLGAVRLAGSATQRRVELDVSVDGAPGSALGVMSQGEVNALALSVFLPRAMLPASPFRFLVIDDPVQAMDPAKVDGLARVLESTASGRQVIVFTHDNRLTQAVRQLNIPATILEVTRRPGSAVQVRTCLDPAEQAWQDARALAADNSLPPEVAARVVPGLCRTAVEATFTDAIWRHQLRAGRRHDEIEEAVEDARVRLNRLAALALAGDASKGGEVLPKLNAWGHRYADTYQILNKGAHVASHGDLRPLTRDAGDLVTKIRAMLS